MCISQCLLFHWYLHDGSLGPVPDSFIWSDLFMYLFCFSYLRGKKKKKFHISYEHTALSWKLK